MSHVTSPSQQNAATLHLAADALDLARRAGATDAEFILSEGEEFSVDVRLGEVETLKQSTSRGAGLRILRGKHTGSAYTSDLSDAGIQKLVQSAIELASVTTEDPFAGLPEDAELGKVTTDLQLCPDDVHELSTGQRIDMAKRAEAAARDFDARITNIDGASFSSYRGRHILANSRGFAGEYSSSYCSIGCVPIARQNEQMERDYWYSSARSIHDLESPEYVGRSAAARAVRRLGAVKVATKKAPIVFEPRVARQFVGDLFEAIEGRSIYRQSTFLLDKLNQTIASSRMTLIDDGTIPGRFGARPFDDEGVATRRTPVIDRGVLRSYLLNTYAARKLGMQTTGNASRGITGNAGIGHGTFYLEPGERTPEEILSSIPDGFYITELIGSGANIATGDFSSGASGLWIENGKLTYPVSEVTIAGSMQQILMDLEPANDLEFRGSVASPTLFVGEMTVGGR